MYLCVVLPGRSCFKYLDESKKDEQGFCGGGSSFDAGTSVGKRASNNAARNPAVPLIRSTSCSVSSNELGPRASKNSTSNSNSHVESAPASFKSPVVVNVSRRDRDENEKKEDEGEADNASRRQLSSSEAVCRMGWNASRDRTAGRSNRRRRRSVNASTQTLSTVDELDDTWMADCDDNGHRDHTVNFSRNELGSDGAEDDQAAVRTSLKDDVQSCVVDILRLTADRQSNRRSQSPTAVPRYSHPAHHHHHHHYNNNNHRHHPYQQHARRLDEYSYNEPNRQPLHSYPSACASCNMRRANFRDAVVITSAPSTLVDSQHRSSPRYCKAVRGRPVIAARRSPAAARATSPMPTSSPPTPSARPDARPAKSDSPSATATRRGPLTEEALRQRIERVLVEMIPRNDDGRESKVAAALRQAIVDSAAFPTLFKD